MEEVKRIYSLLLHSNGLRLREIANELKLDIYYVADVLFSVDNISFWYQDSSSLWFAKEGSIQLDPSAEEKQKEPIVVAKFNDERFRNSCSSNFYHSYIKKLSHYRILSNEEVLELFERYHDGDNKAFEQLVKSHLRLAANIAFLYRNKGVALDDLIQEGNIGLIKAIEHFDYKNFKNFIVYAKSWILQSVLFALSWQPYIIRLPLNQYGLYSRVRRFIDKFIQENDYPPSIYDIKIDGIDDVEKLDIIYNMPDDILELTSLCDDMDCYEKSDANTDAFQELDFYVFLVNTFFKYLDKRASLMLKMYYGIGDYIMRESLNRIGDCFDVTRERARQIVEKAKLKIRQNIVEDNVVISDGDCLLFLPSFEPFLPKVIKSSKKGKNIVAIRNKEGKTKEVIVNGVIHGVVKWKEDAFLTHISDNQKKERECGGVLPASILPTNGRQSGGSVTHTYHDDHLIGSEVSRLGGLKVGDILLYNKKHCKVIKILVKESSSKLIIEYENGVQDMVDNKPSRYTIVHSSTPSSRRKELKIPKSNIPKPRATKKKTMVGEEVPELDGLKVGDNLLYKNRHCKVVKILVKGRSSKLIVEYEDKVRDMIVNNPSSYTIVPSSTSTSHRRESASPKSASQIMSDMRSEAMVGDRVRYGNKYGLVIRKHSRKGSLRLLIKYDDGTEEDVPNDWSRYRIVREIEDDNT